jgi:hypothetical protein
MHFEREEDYRDRVGKEGTKVSPDEGEESKKDKGRSQVIIVYNPTY